MKKISFLLVFILVVSIVTETNSDVANVNNTNTAEGNKEGRFFLIENCYQLKRTVPLLNETSIL